jgi:hypothetical protein
MRVDWIIMDSRAARAKSACFIMQGSGAARELPDQRPFSVTLARHQKEIENLSSCANAPVLTALAVGGKLTKRVHGSIACRGGWSMSGMGWYVVAASRDVTQRLPRCRMTRPNRGKVEVCLFPNNATQSRCRGKGVPLTLCYVQPMGFTCFSL